MNTLFEILSMKRPHMGKNETRVAMEILTRLPNGLAMFTNAADVPMAYVYTTDTESKTLFTAHLDTVHRDELVPNPVVYDQEMEWAYKEDGTPLGADDGAGIWILYKMAEAGIPGTYLFTVGEERGGVGARWVAENAKEFLGQFNRAITFDRKSTHSVITHQSCGRCCSDLFGTTLAEQLTSGMGIYEFSIDDTGVYTDTAEFVNIIPECTNVSAGYSNEHSGNETLDVGYLKTLLSRCLTLDWAALPTVRDPSVREPAWGWDWDDKYAAPDAWDTDALMRMTDEDVELMVFDDPETAVAYLLQYRNEMIDDDRAEDRYYDAAMGLREEN